MEKVEIRAVIKYLYKKGRSPKKIHEDFMDTLGKESPSYTTVKKTVILQELIRKVEDGQQCIIATKTTKIFIAASIPVLDEHSTIGQGIINP
jgi:hypothetical protein